MFDFLFRIWDYLLSVFYNKELELALIGIQGSGKSTMISSFISNEFTDNFQPTVGFNMKVATIGRSKFKFWDIGGQPRFRSMWDRYCSSSNVIIFVIDAADQQKFCTAKQELHSVLNNSQLDRIPLLVLANKNDLQDASSPDYLVEFLELKQFSRPICFYSVSAKTRNGLNNVLSWISENC